MGRLRLSVEYDGTGFAGWQLQPEQRSVQGALEQALAEITGERVRVHGAGRTDAGVHARDMAAHVDLASGLAPLELRKALNAVLPADVAVRRVVEVDPDFDARRDARAKRYLYRILNRAAPSPLRRTRVWHLRARLDVDAMHRAAQPLLGTHDFSAFRGAPGGTPEETPRRSLDRLDVIRDGDEVRVTAEGRSFLRYMVRCLVGTLVEVGQGKRSPDALVQVLASRDRARAGATAPAHGLCLEWVRYPGGDPTG